MSKLEMNLLDSQDYDHAKLLRTLEPHFHEHHRWSASDEYKQLFISLCDYPGNIHGGVLAHAIGTFMHLEFIWVAEPFRRQHYATQMLYFVEKEARNIGCSRAYLESSSSIGTAFCLASGFSICGEIADFRDGQSRFWMHKELTT